MDIKTIEINEDRLHDPKWIHETCMKHEEYPEILFGENEDGESVHISVNEDHILVTTFQKNGWTRNNFYYDDDEMTCEELFDGKWK